MYIAKYSCPKNYVKKAKREFRRRILDNVGDIQNKLDNPLSTHIWEYHDSDPKSLTFCAVEVVRPSPRGGDWDTQILLKETRWIYHLKTMIPMGLNEQLSFSCFI